MLLGYCLQHISNMNKGTFINGVLQIWPKIEPPSPSVTLKWLFHWQLSTECHTIQYPPPSPCATSFIDDPLLLRFSRPSPGTRNSRNDQVLRLNESSCAFSLDFCVFVSHFCLGTYTTNKSFIFAFTFMKYPSDHHPNGYTLRTSTDI